MKAKENVRKPKGVEREESFVVDLFVNETKVNKVKDNAQMVDAIYCLKENVSDHINGNRRREHTLTHRKRTVFYLFNDENKSLATGKCFLYLVRTTNE